MIKIARKILFPEDAKLILMDVVPKHEFNIHMGTSIKNLQELADALEIMDENTFKHHVTKDKNDFSNWIRDVINDIDLSKELLKAKTREETLKTVRKRIEELDKLQKSYCPKEQLRCGVREFFCGLIIGIILGLIIAAIRAGIS